ncbi:MAG: hypothetical protein QOG23_2107 [Blastocatellia bacterium]|jgi:hypothetical protein|nr:hypothetical protein [Blastocatellia bacterium]
MNITESINAIQRSDLTIAILSMINALISDLFESITFSHGV